VLRTPNVQPVLDGQHHIADVKPKLQFRRTSTGVNVFLDSQHHIADVEPKLQFRRTSKAVNASDRARHPC
jgi:hypothetical protein